MIGAWVERPQPFAEWEAAPRLRCRALKELGSPASGKRPALSWARLGTCLVILAAPPSAQKSLRMHACAVAWVMSYSATPMDGSPPGASVHGDSPGKNIAVGCYAFLQGISPTQGSNQCLLRLLHWQVGLLPLVATWEASRNHSRHCKREKWHLKGEHTFFYPYPVLSAFCVFSLNETLWLSKEGNQGSLLWDKINFILWTFFPNHQYMVGFIFNQISGWPTSSFGFFCTYVWENPNKLVGQPNMCISIEVYLLCNIM